MITEFFERGDLVAFGIPVCGLSLREVRFPPRR
jgi:hypothetical protein